MVYRLGREEGILSVSRAVQRTWRPCTWRARCGKALIVVLFADFGDRYLSTNLWLGWQRLP
jgi:hypothetical protein